MNNNSNKIKIYRKRKMSIDIIVNVHVSYVQKVWRVIYRCTVLGCVMCCSGGIWPGEKTVLVSGCFGAQWSVAPARWQQFKERVSWVWGVQGDFFSNFLHSGGLRFLEARQRGTDNPLLAVLIARYSLLMSVLVAEPNQTVIDEPRTDSMMA